MSTSSPYRVIPLGDGTAPGLRGAFRAQLTQRDRQLAVAAGAVAFLAYLVTLAPTVTGEDAGELASAAWTLGIPHPPGYPLYVLLGKAAMTLLPVGDPAYRLNLLSAFLGGSAAALLTLLCLRLAASRPAACASGLIAAFTGIVWSQATIGEVYTLAAVVFLGLVHLVVLYLLEPRPSRLLWVAYFAGLALTAHPSLVLAGPGVLAAVLVREHRALRHPVVILGAGLFFLLGFSVYLYLPLRSLADPVMDWGNPETLDGFLGHLLRTQYAGLSTPAARPGLDHLLYLGHVALFDVGPILVVTAALGLRRLVRFPGAGTWPAERARARAAFYLAYSLWLACFSVALLFFVSVSFHKQTLALNQVFFIPLALLMGPAAALGLDRLTAWVVGWAQRRRDGLSALATARLRWGTALVLPVLLFLVNVWSQDRSGYTIARDYAEAILTTLPPNAVYIPSGDHATFPVLYVQIVEGKRPDVTVADKYGYLDPQVLKRLGATEQDLRALRSLPREESDRWLIDRSGRAVFVNAKRSILEISPDRFLPVGVLYRVDRERRALSREAEDRLWASYRFGNLTDDYRWRRGPRDGAGDCILAEILTHRAELLFEREEAPAAVSLLGRIADVADGYREILQNTGSLLAERGYPREAARFYEQALGVDPGYAQCRRNYARALLESGDVSARAIALAERALDAMGPDPTLLILLGKAYRARKQPHDAYRAFRAASRLRRGDAESVRLAGEVAEADLHAPEEAKRLFAESLRRKPTQPALIEKVHGKEARTRYEARAKEALAGMLEPHLPKVPRAAAASPVPVTNPQPRPQPRTEVGRGAVEEGDTDA